MSRILIGVCSLVMLITAPALAGGGSSGYGGGGWQGGATASSGKDPVRNYQQGIAHLQAEEYVEAEAAFKSVLKVAGKDANTHYLLGLAYFGQSKWKDASRSFRNALRHDRDFHVARGKLAVTYVLQGEEKKARSQLSALERAHQRCNGACPKHAKIESALSESRNALQSVQQASLN